MERKQIRAEAALQALIDLQATLATRPSLVMVELGLMTQAQAASAMRETAAWAEQEESAEPFVGYAIGQALRDHADTLETKVTLQLIEGGRAD